MIGSVVSVRGPFNVNRAVHKIERAALVLAKPVELHDRFAGSVVGVGDVAGASAVDVDWRVVGVPAGRVADQVRRDSIRSVGHVDGVKALNVVSVAADCFPAFDDKIQYVRVRINDRRACNSYFGANISRARIPVWYRCDRGGAERIVDVAGGVGYVQKSALPEHRSAGGTGVDGVEAVVLGGNEDHVMNPGGASLRVSSIGDGDTSFDKGFGINLAVHGSREKLAERANFNIDRGQLIFIRV